MLYFSAVTSPLSNSYQTSPYQVETARGWRTVTSAEQHIALLKAIYFDDKKATHRLSQPTTPDEAKAIGKQIGTGDEWAKIFRVDSPYNLAEEYMYQVLKAKYANCLAYRAVIDAHPGTNFVGAFEDYDWGAGVSAQETPEEEWGANWLGKAHRRLAMEVHFSSGMGSKAT